MSRDDRGFTLLELMTVLAIIAILAAVVSPMVFRHVGDARVQAAAQQINALTLALDGFYGDVGRYPTNEEGLAVLRDPPPDLTAARRWRGPYLRRDVPIDPWGRPYMYERGSRPGEDPFFLGTLGRDGSAGGEGEDADLGSFRDLR